MVNAAKRKLTCAVCTKTIVTLFMLLVTLLAQAITTAPATLDGQVTVGHAPTLMNAKVLLV